MATHRHNTHRASSKRDPKQPKRGIVLLVVISLLALFVLLGVTYAIVASGYRDAANTIRQIGATGDPPDREMDLVLYQLLCDTQARSAIRGHGLLNDLYGTGSLEGTVVNVPTPPAPFDTTAAGSTQPQAWSFYFTPAPGVTPYPILDYYAGRVITFHDLGGKDYSTRILQYFYDATNGQYSLVVEAIESQGSFVAITAGSEFFINGPPFCGTGAGRDFITLGIDAVYVNSNTVPSTIPPPTSDLVALLPHFNGYDLTAGRIAHGASGATTYVSANTDAGAANEPWDAVDFQNMFLAMVPPSAAALNTDGNSSNNIPIIPSFHRPELVNYWVEFIKSTILSTAGVTTQADQYMVMALPYGPDRIRNNSDDNSTAPWSNVTIDQRDRIYNITRGSIFRPMAFEHPNFTGSNPIHNTNDPFTMFEALINRSNQPFWDVDNDNDTVPDSIWVDPGLPVITAADGKRYKRLAAILVKDLDGRIDLNAHGNLFQVFETPSPGMYSYRGDWPVQEGTMTAPRKLMRGNGFGPAEVSFYHLFNPSNVPNDPAGTLAYGNLLRGRYESSYVNTTTGNPDRGTYAFPGIPGMRENLDLVKHHGVRNLPFEFLWNGSLPDVWGRGAITLYYGGQPLTSFSGGSVEMVDNPYELLLNGPADGRDSPYVPVELEKLLRFHDPDARQLVSRPLSLAGNYLAASAPGVIGTDHTLREKLTSLSSHISASKYAYPRELRGSGIHGPTILDVFFVKVLAANGASFPGNAAQQQAANRILSQILPWEIRHGQPFDLNRWFGNGFDIQGAANGVADDPSEGATGLEQAWSNNTNAGYGPTPNNAPAPFAGTIAQGTNGMDADMDGVFDSQSAPDLGDRALVRQLYARHLFCLLGVLLDNVNSGALYTENGTGPFRDLMALQRLAQWCINVVDFRDPDAIMTPFEYDINPLNGWQVDGNPATDGTSARPERIDTDGNPGAENHVFPPGNNERYVVWGVEYPELMLMETLAFHDRRTKDLVQDRAMNGKVGAMAPNRDDHVDQFRIPQGSLFVELYCPHNRLNASEQIMPRELYSFDSANNQWRLDLGRLHPTPDSAGVRHPVWQIVVSEQTFGNAAKEQSTPLQRPAVGKVDTTTFDPISMNAFGGEPLVRPAGAPLDATTERLIWFANYPGGGPPAGTYEGDRAFVNSLGWDVSISPGQYAVVGPRTATYMGSQNDGNNATMWDGDSRQSIILKTLNRANPMDTGAMITATAAGNDPTYTVPAGNIRSVVGIVADARPPAAWMNANRRIGLNISEPLPQSGAYYEEPNPTNDGRIPADAYDDPAGPTNNYPDVPLDRGAGKPLAEFGNRLYPSDTYQDVRSLFLQRLANPLEPWNPDPNDPIHGTRFDSSRSVNPYITVDWSTVDLTVFNGEENINQQSMGATPKDFDQLDPTSGAFDYEFSTRERGPSTFPGSANPWPSESRGPQNTNPGGAAVYFRDDLRSTLGYVNQYISTPHTSPPNAGYVGEPQKAFPWLAWNNRPFSTPYELMLVPTSTPSRLFYEFPRVDGYATPELAGYDPYVTHRTSHWPQHQNPPTFNLLNFFYSHQNPRQSPLHQRLFDYVEVRSPFMGAEKWYNPSQFGNAGLYRPPFNFMSRFRDPGRININTMFDIDIWYAALGHTLDGANPNLAGRGGELMLSRQGYGTTSTDIYTMNSAYPTRFANPFRPADAADLMPNVPPTSGMRQARPVDATLLRPVQAGSPNPLLQMTVNAQWNEEFRDIRRNPYFRYQGFQKLGNILTTHSNCFAVWITMGYFEVEENGAVDAAHPDGYRLGQEVGFDTGEVTRHRAFFIIDRSVPVGFQPGIRHNADKCVLLRRMIE